MTSYSTPRHSTRKPSTFAAVPVNPTYFMNVNVVHETGMLKGRSKISFHSITTSTTWSMRSKIISTSTYPRLPRWDSTSMWKQQLLRSYYSQWRQVEEWATFSAIMQNDGRFPNHVSARRWPMVSLGRYTNRINPDKALWLWPPRGYKDMFESTVVAILNYNQSLTSVTKGLGFKALFSFQNWIGQRISAFGRSMNIVLKEWLPMRKATPYIFKHLKAEHLRSRIWMRFKVYPGDRNYYFQSYIDYNGRSEIITFRVCYSITLVNITTT